MSHVMRSSLKFYPSCGFVNKFVRSALQSGSFKQRSYSTLWNISMKSMKKDAVKFISVSNKFVIPMKQYCEKIRRTSETEFDTFLQQKIEKMKQRQNHRYNTYYENLPSKIHDFEVELDGSKFTLVKSLPGETITVRIDINNCQDLNDAYWSDNFQLNGYEFFSTIPSFNVDVKKGDTTLTFRCHYTRSDEEDDTWEEREIARCDFGSDAEEWLFDFDVFRIDSFVLHRGKQKMKKITKKITTFSTLKDFHRKDLYDAMENFLNKKGITNGFVREVCDFSTEYMRAEYIKILEKLKNFNELDLRQV